MGVKEKLPKVTVLLATFNGVRFLEEQLTSLFDQQDVDIEVMVNDDGSTDGTINILENWRTKGLIVSISQSRGLGATRAFLSLLQSCDQKEFVAFCDQDDIWARNKLISQVNSLNEDTPMMSSCLRVYINETGKEIGKSKNLRKPPSFANSVFENITPGNTMLLNNSAVKLINSMHNPPVVHYDSWIYLLISAFGKVNLIPSHFVKYRIHSNNSVGLRKKSIKATRKAIQIYLNQQAFLYEKKFDILSQNQREYLKSISFFVEEPKLSKKILSIRKLRINRQSNLEEIFFKMLILFLK